MGIKISQLPGVDDGNISDTDLLLLTDVLSGKTFSRSITLAQLGAYVQTNYEPEVDDVPDKATNTDVDAETDDAKYMTVAKTFRAIDRKVKNASTTVAGIGMLARATDVGSTETDTSRLLTVATGKTLIDRLAPPARFLPAGGTKGQIPHKKSATDYDVEWTDPTAAVAVPAKATNTDVDTETDDTKYVTVAKVFRAIARKVKAATNSAAGIVTLARNEDVDSTETDTGRVTTVAMAKRLITRIALLKSGGTLTGKLTLDGAPTSDLHAATKAYADFVSSLSSDQLANLQHITRDLHTIDDPPDWSNALDTDGDIYAGLYTNGTEVVLTDANFDGNGASFTIPKNSQGNTKPTIVYIRLKIGTDISRLALDVEDLGRFRSNTWSLAGEHADSTIPTSNTHVYYLVGTFDATTRSIDLQLEKSDKTLYTEFAGLFTGDVGEESNVYKWLSALSHLTSDLYAPAGTDGWVKPSDDTKGGICLNDTPMDHADIDGKGDSDYAVEYTSGFGGKYLGARIPDGADPAFYRIRIQGTNGSVVNTPLTNYYSEGADTATGNWDLYISDYWTAVPGASVAKLTLEYTETEDHAGTSRFRGGLSGQKIYDATGLNSGLVDRLKASLERWVNTKTYSPEHLVVHVNQIWVALKLNINKEPGIDTGNNWATLVNWLSSIYVKSGTVNVDALKKITVALADRLIASVGKYSATATYAADAMVVDSEFIWVSQQDGNTGNSPASDDGTWWVTLAAYVKAQATAGATGLTTTTGDQRYVKKAGDTMTGKLTLDGAPTSDLHAATKKYVDGKTGGTSLTKASNTDVDTETDDSDYMTVLKTFRAIGRKVKNASTTVRGIVLLARTTDVNVNETDTSRVPTIANVKTLITRLFLPKTGGTLTGKLTLDGDPTSDKHAATKKYVDDNAGNGGGTGEENVQSDWDQTDDTADDYIKNKPTSLPGGGSTPGKRTTLYEDTNTTQSGNRWRYLTLSRAPVRGSRVMILITKATGTPGYRHPVYIEADEWLDLNASSPGTDDKDLNGTAEGLIVVAVQVGDIQSASDREIAIVRKSDTEMGLGYFFGGSTEKFKVVEIAPGGGSSGGSGAYKHYETLPDADDFEVNDLIEFAGHSMLLQESDSTADTFSGTTGTADVHEDREAINEYIGIANVDARDVFAVTGLWNSNPGNEISYIMEHNGTVEVGILRSAYRTAKGSNEATGDNINLRMTINSTTETIGLQYVPSNDYTADSYGYREGIEYLVFAGSVTGGGNFVLQDEGEGQEFSCRILNAGETANLFTHTADTKHWILYHETDAIANEITAREALQKVNDAIIGLNAVQSKVRGLDFDFNNSNPKATVTIDKDTVIDGRKDPAWTMDITDVDAQDDILVIEWENFLNFEWSWEHQLPGSTNAAGRMYIHLSDELFHQNVTYDFLGRSVDPLRANDAGTFTDLSSPHGAGIEIHRTATGFQVRIEPTHESAETNRNNLQPPANFSITIKLYGQESLAALDGSSLRTKIDEVEDKTEELENRLVVLTEAEYTALATKDPAKFYFTYDG